MLFSDDFLEQLPDNPTLATSEILDRYFDNKYRLSMEYEDYIELYCALEALCPLLPISFDLPKLSESKKNNIDTISEFCSSFQKEVKKHRTLEETKLFSEKYSDRFKRRFASVFLYQFTDGDLARIQTLLNELRDGIVASELFEASHKQRILQKLENLQSELHKKMSSLDKFWGLIGDAGIVLGKFGKDAKPFVDRIKEIAQIIWRTQAKAEELPSDVSLPLLKSKEDE